MGKQVKVTSAQVRAAQTMVRRAAEKGEAVPPKVLKIANATPTTAAAGDTLVIQVEEATLPSAVDAHTALPESQTPAEEFWLLLDSDSQTTDRQPAYIFHCKSVNEYAPSDLRNAKWSSELRAELTRATQLLRTRSAQQSQRITSTKEDEQEIIR